MEQSISYKRRTKSDFFDQKRFGKGDKKSLFHIQQKVANSHARIEEIISSQ